MGIIISQLFNKHVFTPWHLTRITGDRQREKFYPWLTKFTAMTGACNSFFHFQSMWLKSFSDVWFGQVFIFQGFCQPANSLGLISQRYTNTKYIPSRDFEILTVECNHNYKRRITPVTFFPGNCTYNDLGRIKGTKSYNEKDLMSRRVTEHFFIYYGQNSEIWEYPYTWSDNGTSSKLGFCVRFYREGYFFDPLCSWIVTADHCLSRLSGRRAYSRAEVKPH